MRIACSQHRLLFLDAFSWAHHSEKLFVILIPLMDINVSLPWIDTLNSFSFRPWIGLIWEISARNRHQISSFFGARFFVKLLVPKHQYSMICAIFRFFRILFLKNVLVPKCPGQARAQPHGQGPYWGLAGPIYGPGQAHMWAWPT